MPLFLIERQFADQIELNRDQVENINRINDEVGVSWLYSFLSADKKKTYCLYEAPSAEAVREAAKRLDMPADTVLEVGRLDPAQYLGDAPSARLSA